MQTMTVWQLIQLLMDYDPQTPIWVNDDGEIAPIRNIQGFPGNCPDDPKKGNPIINGDSSDSGG